MLYGLNLIALGYTRVVGVTAYNPESKSFDEITIAAARKEIDAGNLKGLRYVKTCDGYEFLPDEEFGMKTLLVKSGVGKFRDYQKDDDIVNSVFCVVRIIDADYRGRLYEVVSNKCQRFKIDEDLLRGLSDITSVAGVRIADDEIVALDGVVYEDRRAKEKVEKTVAKKTNKQVSKKKFSRLC